MVVDRSDRPDVARKMQERLRQLIGHLRQDRESVDDPALAARLETARAVLEGLEQSFSEASEEPPGPVE